MRNLHAVAVHEKFVASGVYRYTRDGVPLGVREAFTIHEFDGDALFYRVDEDGRDEDGLTILSEALVNPEQRYERFNVQSFNSKDPVLKPFKADYTFQDDYVQIARSVAGQDREYEEFVLKVECVMYLRQTVFMGRTIREIERRENKAQVFRPALLSTEENVLQKIIVQSVGYETIEAGRRAIEAEKFQIADDVFYYLDEHDIPVKREYWHDGAHYEVFITDYAYR